MINRRIFIADLALLGITFIWGTTFIIVQNILDKLTPLTFNGWRFCLAALFLAVWQFLFMRKSNGSSKKYNWKLIGSAILLGTLLFAGYICQTIGLLYTSASNAAFITGLSVVLVPIFSALLLRKPPHRNAIIGVVFAAFGLFLLTTKGQFSLNKGDLIVLVSAVTFALHIIFTAKVTDKFESMSLTIVQLSVVALLAFVVGLFFDGGKLVDVRMLLQPDVSLVLIFMALFATAFAFLLQTVLQKDTPATHVGIIYIMEPVFAAWTSVLFQNAHLGTGELTGSLLILAGMLLAEWPQKRGQSVESH
ncbi:DMT family transporter [Sporolactobacillus kofuensis]|uniref:DMT family transporter n=1 Tax=Sporolactobacillus kofuensis TaxID=269672 RepID=A0ABW1WH89_9BACL|nr:DMT family transporter [Sporolactobacillus kofuensis]MCO7176256.1 DMT family transporter [Sporolactobacillus kofuensis]